MELKEGYKNTEVGLVPDNWEVTKLKFCLAEKPRYGIGAAAVDFDFNYPTYLRITDIEDDGTLRKSDLKSVCHPDADNYYLNEGDIVFARTGASVGKTYLHKLRNGKFVYAGFLIKVSTDEKKLKPGYLKSYTETKPYWNWVKVNSMRSGQPGINGNEYGDMLFPLPPLPEQKAIVNVLSDADSLIQALEKKIAKKELIKKGAMQKLLTPKDGWEEFVMPEVCWFQEGPGVRNAQFTNTGVKLLNGTNIEKGKLLLEKTDRYISCDEAFGWYAHFLVDENDILIACSGVTIEKFHEKVTVAESKHLPLCMNTSTMRFKTISKNLVKKYLFHFLKSSSFKKQIGGKATGSAQLNFGPSHVAKVYINMPLPDEQTVIATVLSDMDNEIELLEKNLAKYKQLKQGLMQNLLTGKIRLV